MINLCLVVIATQFSETKRRETERMLAERAQRAQQKNRSQSSSTIASSGGGGGLDVAGCYVEVVRYLEYLAGSARRRLARAVRRLRRRQAAAAAAAAAAVDRPPALPSSSPRRRRRHRVPSDAPAAVDHPPLLPDSTPAGTHGVAVARGVSEATPDADAQSPAVTAATSPRRAKSAIVANSDCLQIANTGLSP